MSIVYLLRKQYSLVSFLILFLCIPPLSKAQTGIVESFGCDSVLLSASVAGNSYSWSTGDTTSSLHVYQSDTLWVDIDTVGGTQRDSFLVWVGTTPPIPTLNDTAVCSGTTLTLTNNTSDNVFWYENSVSSANLVGSGAQLPVPVKDSTTYFAEPINYYGIVDAGLKTPTGVGSNIVTSRGLFFDVKQPLFIQEVSIHAQDDYTVQIKVNRSNRTYLIDTLQLDSGLNKVQLDLYLPVGTNYLISLFAPYGALVSVTPGAPFPVENAFIKIARSSIPNTAEYKYFYDWKIAPVGCMNSASSMEVFALPASDIDFPSDTTVCDGGPLTLDATFPGASYAWSNGDTTAQLTLLSSDTVWVNSTVGTCMISDTIRAILPDSLIPFGSQDTIICGPEEFPLPSAQSSNGFIFWFEDSLSSNDVIASGDGASIFVNQSQQVFYPQEVTLNDPIGIGLDTTGISTVGGFANSGDKGYRFTVKEDIFLNSVTMYANSVFTADIELENATGQVINQQTVQFAIGQNVIDLNFYIPAGNNYELYFRPHGTAHIYTDEAYAFPFVYPYVTLVKGLPVGRRMPFYDWQIQSIGCQSDRGRYEINISLPLDLPDSIFTCHDTVFQSNIQANSYLWNTGDTTAQIQVDSAGLYLLTLTDTQGCVVSDSTILGLPKPAYMGEDGSICGDTLFSGYDSGEGTFLWNTNDVGNFLIISSPGQYWVQVVDSNNCVLSDTINIIKFNNFPDINLGGDISACDSTMLDAGNPGSVYLWSTNDTTQAITATQTGRYKVTVTNTTGCTIADSINVNINLEPSALFTFQVKFNDPATVDFFNLSSLGGAPSSIRWEWFFGDGSMDSNTSPTHTYLDSGTYQVQLVITTDCGSDTFDQFVQIILPVGIDESNLAQTIEIAPNPAHERFFIEAQMTMHKPFSVSLYDYTGRRCFIQNHDMIRKDEAIEIDVSSLTPGIYYVSFNGSISGAKAILVR